MRFSRVLIAIDESALAARALEAGAALAGALGAEVGIVHVLDPRLLVGAAAGAPPEAVRAEFEKAGRVLIATAAARVAGDRAPWQFVAWGQPAKVIVSSAHEWGADLIVVGSHGRGGVSQLLMGSTAEGVLRRAPCPVLAVPGHVEAAEYEPSEPAADAAGRATEQQPGS